MIALAADAGNRSTTSPASGDQGLCGWEKKGAISIAWRQGDELELTPHGVGFEPEETLFLPILCQLAVADGLALALLEAVDDATKIMLFGLDHRLGLTNAVLVGENN
jgi:hypothetical protein